MDVAVTALLAVALFGMRGPTNVRLRPLLGALSWIPPVTG
jgi:hypothetical protein